MGPGKEIAFEKPKGAVVVMNSASFSALIDPKKDPEKDPVNQVGRNAKAQEYRTLDLGRKDGTTAESNGIMNRGQDAVAETIALAKKKEKEARAMRSALNQARKALEARLEELNKQIARLDKQIEALEGDISRTEKDMKDKFGSDWKENFKKGEIDNNDPLYQQWLLQQQRVADLKNDRDELLNERDRTKELLKRVEAGDPTALDEMKANEAKREGQTINTNTVLKTKDSQAVVKLEAELGIKGATIERSSILNGDASNEALGSFFDEEPSTIAFSKTIEESPINAPPMGEQFAKAGNPNESVASVENNPQIEKLDSFAPVG